jgi:hypothetical protein
MMRIALLFVAVAACNKPDKDDCRKAIDNMQHIIGTENLSNNGDNEGDIRRCRGGSSKEAVACAIKATSKDDLVKCDFMKAPMKKAAPETDGGSDAKK